MQSNAVGSQFTLDHGSDGPIDPSNPRPRTQRRKHAAEKGADAGGVGSVNVDAVFDTRCCRSWAAANNPGSIVFFGIGVSISLPVPVLSLTS